jgi:hypothetical protein
MSGEPRSWLGRWQRRESWPAVTGIMPYALLIVLAAITLSVRTTDGAALPVDLSLCALAAGWMLFMWRLHPTWRNRVPHVVVFVVGLQLITAALVLWEALALGSGWFGFLAAVCFAYTRALPRLSWQLAGAAGVAFIAASSQTAGMNTSEIFHVTVGIVALTVDLLLMGSLMWLLWEHDQQAARNQRALAELGAANRRLEATIAENEGLHRQLVVHAREAGSGSAWRGRSTTRWPRASPGLSPSCRRPSRPLRVLLATQQVGGGTSMRRHGSLGKALRRRAGRWTRCGPSRLRVVG